jgi:hypothetical protein
MAQMRSPHRIEQCLSLEEKRKTSARTEYFAFWHFCDTPTSPCEVRSPGCPGKHLLRLSHSDFEARAEVIVL